MIVALGRVAGQAGAGVGRGAGGVVAGCRAARRALDGVVEVPGQAGRDAVCGVVEEMAFVATAGVDADAIGADAGWLTGRLDTREADQRTRQLALAHVWLHALPVRASELANGYALFLVLYNLPIIARAAYRHNFFD